MKTSLPKGLVITGGAVVVIAWLFAARLLWEQTVLSWDSGPQNVGFAIMHTGLGGLLIIVLYGGLLWVLAVLIAMAVKQTLGGPWIIGLLACYGLAWAAISAPYGFWQRLFIDRYSTQHASEFFTRAAALGDARTVEAFLAHGVDVNTQGRYGTALHGAAVQNELDMIKFLLSKGADVNALNKYGDTPLGYAYETVTPDTRALLMQHGGVDIRGSEEERERIISEEVRRDIEEMDKRRLDP